MSALEAISVGLSILTALGLIVSLLFLYRQTRDLSRQTEHLRLGLRSDTMAKVQDWWFQVSGAYVTYPQLRPFFYEDEHDGVSVDQLGDEDRLRLIALTEMIADVLDAMVIQRAAASDLEEAIAPWDAFFADIFGISRVLREYVLERESWYQPRLVALAREATDRVKVATGEPGTSAIPDEAAAQRGVEEAGTGE